MSIYYYHSLNENKHFNTYKDCEADLDNELEIFMIEDYIALNYSQSSLASKFLDILFINDKSNRCLALEDFYKEIIRNIHEDWIFEDESDFEEGVCSSCAFIDKCSKCNPSISNCRKWAWLSWDSKDPFAEE